MGKDHGIWISQKTWKRKVSKEPVSSQPYLSKFQEVDLVFFIFFLIFILFSDLFPYLLFVELRARDNHMTQKERYRISELQEVGLALFSLFSIFQFSFLFLFLAPRVRIGNDTGHMAQGRF